MKKIILVFVLSIFAMPSFAKGFGRFGLEDSMHIIQPLDFTFSEGEVLDLSSWTQTRYFVAGVYIKDKGYVLTVRNSKKYIPLDDEMIADMQKENLLPTPMPEYKIGLLDYLMGYSLWIFFGLATIWGLFDRRRKID